MSGPACGQRLSAKTPSMPQIRQLSVKRLKFHLSRKPFSRRALRVDRSFGYFSPNHIGGWPPLIDPQCPNVYPFHNSAPWFRAGLCGETSSATSETFSPTNFRRKQCGAGALRTGFQRGHAGNKCCPMNTLRLYPARFRMCLNYDEIGISLLLLSLSLSFKQQRSKWKSADVYTAVIMLQGGMIFSAFMLDFSAIFHAVIPLLGNNDLSVKRKITHGIKVLLNFTRKYHENEDFAYPI